MTNEELEDEIYTLYLQNNTEKIDFDKAFKFGIECAIDHLTELNLLPIQIIEVTCCDRSKQIIKTEQLKNTNCFRCKEEL